MAASGGRIGYRKLSEILVMTCRRGRRVRRGKERDRRRIEREGRKERACDHNYICHDYIGRKERVCVHNYLGHKYKRACGHNYIGHKHIGRKERACGGPTVRWRPCKN